MCASRQSLCVVLYQSGASGDLLLESGEPDHAALLAEARATNSAGKSKWEDRKPNMMFFPYLHAIADVRKASNAGPGGGKFAISTAILAYKNRIAVKKAEKGVDATLEEVAGSPGVVAAEARGMLSLPA
jgi:hypothetical protein